jgi:hypothetical protein
MDRIREAINDIEQDPMWYYCSIDPSGKDIREAQRWSVNLATNEF